MSAHPSSSHEHRAAEAVILAHVAAELGLVDLQPTRLQLGDVAVELDGWSASTQTAVEVYARVTPLKGATIKKVMDDAMRLILVRRHHPSARLCVAFATEEIAAYYRGSTRWRAAAIEAADIEVVSANIDDDLLASLEAATERQFR